MSDRQFDQVYSSELRFLSRQHWTPVRVARSAARLLTDAGAKVILDVGSGAGKFCIIGALTTPATYVGLERRAHLVEAAREAAAHFGVRRVRFSKGNLVDFDCAGFDGFYLFNPFYEQLGAGLVPIDGQIEPSKGLYRRYVGATEEKLGAAAPGSVVVTYHGFGGILPGYEQIHAERSGNDRLELWKKG